MRTRFLDLPRLKVWHLLLLEAAVAGPARRRGAAYELRRYGPHAQPAVSDLRRLLSDPDAEVRAAASAALQQIEPGDATSPSIP